MLNAHCCCCVFVDRGAESLLLFLLPVWAHVGPPVLLAARGAEYNDSCVMHELQATALLTGHSLWNPWRLKSQQSQIAGPHILSN